MAEWQEAPSSSKKLKIDAEALRKLILNTRRPIVLKNAHPHWPCCGKTLGDWCQQLDDQIEEPLRFETMPLKNGSSPQWERRRGKSIKTSKEFEREYSGQEAKCWAGMNYQAGATLPKRISDGIDFSAFGFPQLRHDFSYWLSSKGANTPCHYDTYGCNIVVQVHGSKSWLLFPPGTPLTTTRVPYEESSVYCLENFYSPNESDLFALEQLGSYVHHCVLEANDVLVVPRHWWHYVETVENSLAINAWVPLEIDKDAQLEEAIVKFIVERFVMPYSDDVAILRRILNPNEFTTPTTDDELFVIIEALSAESCPSASPKERTKYPYHYLPQKDVEDLMTNFFPKASPVPKLERQQFKTLLKTNGSRYAVEEEEEDGPDIRENFLNSLCAPQIVSSIKNELLKRLKPKT